ncbi:MAG TPA: hypothetical protein VFO84_06410 [Dehalococcoidia bacterium]|nr:hypothetical protein [Dehalococcoidia bacterium]
MFALASVETSIGVVLGVLIALVIFAALIAVILAVVAWLLSKLLHFEFPWGRKSRRSTDGIEDGAISQLERLVALRDAGILTEDELAEQKKLFLAR